MKIQIKNYSFQASQRKITFTDYASIDIDSVLYIIHVTDNRAIYNPMNKNLKGSVFGNVLTLNYDTSLMSDNDELMIYYDKIPDPATEGKQDDQITALQSIAGNINSGAKETTQLEVKSLIDETLQDYHIARKNVDGSTTYFIFLNKAGDWYIMQKGSSRISYAFGSGDYELAEDQYNNLAYYRYDIAADAPIYGLVNGNTYGSVDGLTYSLH